jgi:outer membrane protein assembly factor BamA
MTDFKKIICCSLLLLSFQFSYAQKPKPGNITLTGTSLFPVDSNQKVCVNSLLVTGTKKTKIYIVYREIHFKKGDSLVISELQKELEQARHQVYNTTLFNEVSIDLVAIDAYQVNITVRVTERWYLYPVPHFQPVDRNFNDWVKTHNASLERVNYGVKFVHYNLSGRRDQLRIYLIGGYTRNISFYYTNPYSNPALTHGFGIGAGYAQNRETPYKTDSGNKILFYNKDYFTRSTAYGTVAFTIRKGLFKKHIFSIGYSNQKVDDSIINVKYNPNYFNDAVNSKDIIDLAYTLQYSNVNNVSYPLTGRIAYFTAQKRGLGFTGGINMLMLEAGWNKYFDMGKNWYSSIQMIGKIKLPFEQAYINQRGLGYGENYLRGLEYYVVDGVVTALVKSTVKKKIIAFSIPFSLFPKVLTKIPFTIFAKTYADVGYAYNKKTTYTYLNNRLLYSGGFGIDILTLYDINLRFEYSFNQLKENGLFLHNQSGF